MRLSRAQITLDTVAARRQGLGQGTKAPKVADLIATAGTALAAVDLLRQGGAEVLAAAFVSDLPDRGGAARLRAAGVPVATLVAFEGD